MGGGKVAGRTVGRQVESGKRGQDLDLCHSRTACASSRLLGFVPSFLMAETQTDPLGLLLHYLG